MGWLLAISNLAYAQGDGPRAYYPAPVDTNLLAGIGIDIMSSANDAYTCNIGFEAGSISRQSARPVEIVPGGPTSVTIEGINGDRLFEMAGTSYRIVASGCQGSGAAPIMGTSEIGGGSVDSIISSVGQ